MNLLTSFLTNFDKFCDNSFSQVLKKNIDVERTKSCMELMRNEFLDSWDTILYNVNKVIQKKGNCEIIDY